MRKAIAVIGEGITEKYYIESLKGLTPFDIKPRELSCKASSMDKLGQAIKKCIDEGYDEVYCLIDMDTKKEGKNKENYDKLKSTYHKTHIKKKKGIVCKVVFIETDRCLELWFLYHFTGSAITREFTCYKDLEKELKKYRPDYCKEEKHFRDNNLHEYLTAPKKEGTGCLKKACKNAENSIQSKERDNRPHTYSEMHTFIKALKIIQE